jgi:NAD(P)-dependent dehydrogenase (short-subunit alcohol dehydrogenase family)
VTPPLPRTPSFRLDGRRALVIGGSSGIGLGASVALAEAGAHVVVAARGRERVEAVAAEIVAAGYSAEGVVMDVSDVPAMPGIFDRIGRLDILVHSAGLARHSQALETTTEDFDAVASVNWRSAHFAAREAARRMIERGEGGSIILVSSQMGHVGGVDRSVYAASKHALEGMTKAMAIEWGPHRVRVNTLAPTFIRTPLTEPTFANPERVAWIQSMIRLGRVGEVEDLMGGFVFLASDASALMTGASLVIDGGWTAA